MRRASKVGGSVVKAAADALEPATRDAVGVAVEEEGDHLVLEHAVERGGVEVVVGLRRGAAAVVPPPITKPFVPSKASSHQPSRIERCSAPLAAAFMPDVPLASRPRTGVFTQTSTPRTNSRARPMS